MAPDVRLANRDDAAAIGQLLYVFNREFDEPAPHLFQLIGAMSQNPAVANEFTDNFNQPERQWDILATPERTGAFLARHGM